MPSVDLKLSIGHPTHSMHYKRYFKATTPTNIGYKATTASANKPHENHLLSKAELAISKRLELILGVSIIIFSPYNKESGSSQREREIWVARFGPGLRFEAGQSATPSTSSLIP